MQGVDDFDAMDDRSVLSHLSTLEGTDLEGSERTLSTSATSAVVPCKPAATGKGRNKANAHTQVFCNVCGHPSVKGRKQCNYHLAVVKHIVDYHTEKSAGDKTFEDKLKEFNELRENAPDDAPSEFSSYVVVWQEQFPARGRGKKRSCSQCDAMQIHERHIAKTSVAKGTRLMLMHEDGFVFRDRALVIRSEFCITP